MDIKTIKDTIDSLELFLIHTGSKLNKQEKEDMLMIIDGLKRNLDKPDQHQIMQLVLLLFKILAEGADLFKHLL